MLYTDKPLPTVTSWQALKLHHNQSCHRPHLQASMSVVAAAVVAVGVQGMRYCTMTLLDNLDKCVAWSCLASQPAPVCVKTQAELCCCNPVYM